MKKNRVFTKKELLILRKNRLKNLDIMIGISTLLDRLAIKTLGQLIRYSRKELVEKWNKQRGGTGKTGFDDLENQLKTINLHLKK